IAQCNPDANIEIVYVFDPNKAKSEALNHWDVEYVGDQRKRRIKSVEEIVYVFDPNKAKSEALNHWDVEYVGDQRKRRIKSVEEIVSRSGVSYETTVLNGEPRHMLVDYANRNEVDLVVIGSRGLNVLQEMVLGSVSHKVAKRANCPVLIVK